MRDYYSQIASGYNELHAEEQLQKAELIRGRADPYGLLLDIGAGTGIALQKFPNALPIALDPSIGMLKQFSGIKICAKAEELPFRGNAFDSVVSISALHHADLEKAFSEIRRVSKHNALIAVSFFARAKKILSAKKIFKGFECIKEKNDLVFFNAHFSKPK